MLSTEKGIGNLILNRRPGLAVQIGGDILITYLGQDENDAARLIISAPRNMGISRVKFEDDKLIKQ